jgi:hypothetical protein
MAQQEDQKRMSAFNAYQVIEKNQDDVKAALQKTQDPKIREKLLAEANYTIQTADPYAKLQKHAQAQ